MKFKIIDASNDNYIKVFDDKLKEEIVIHPGVREDSKIEGDYLIAPDDAKYVKRDIHAIRCNCSKCTGLKTNIMKHIADENIPVVFIEKFYNKEEPDTDFEGNPDYIDGKDLSEV